MLDKMLDKMVHQIGFVRMHRLPLQIIAQIDAKARVERLVGLFTLPQVYIIHRYGARNWRVLTFL